MVVLPGVTDELALVVVGLQRRGVGMQCLAIITVIIHRVVLGGMEMVLVVV